MASFAIRMVIELPGSGLFDSELGPWVIVTWHQKGYWVTNLTGWIRFHITGVTDDTGRGHVFSEW